MASASSFLRGMHATPILRSFDTGIAFDAKCRRIPKSSRAVAREREMPARSSFAALTQATLLVAFVRQVRHPLAAGLTLTGDRFVLVTRTGVGVGEAGKLQPALLGRGRRRRRNDFFGGRLVAVCASRISITGGLFRQL